MTTVAGLNVSRETSERIDALKRLVSKWNPHINLIARGDIPKIDDRHIANSAELARFLPASGCRYVDLGSGGGFPGLVVAILRADRNAMTDVHLIESDARKCAFLATAAREIGLKLTVHNARIEDVPPLHADFLSARALAPLSTLLSYALRHGAAQAVSLFLKGRAVAEEVVQARADWSFNVEIFPLAAHLGGNVVRVTDVRRRCA